MRLNFNQIEKKWHDNWEKDRLSSFDPESNRQKLYCMEMFCYPSGANLHMGHWFNFGLADSWARFKKMQGYEIFHPIGFDAFGLPAENYAIQTNTHPSIKTYESIATMRKQFQEMDGMFDWDHEIITCDPKYYRWTQWIFLQLYKHNLAYKKEAPVNWCDSCKTVLSNEQSDGGVCERCGSSVRQKRMKQWFLRITDYAQELLDGLEQVDWPELTREQQKNWIGRSEGAKIQFAIDRSDQEVTVYTTRPDTLFGATYLVLAPEHDLVQKITTPQQMAQVEAYTEKTATMTEIERQSTAREKTGVFTGAYAVNPMSGDKIPVWISDYVLVSYGTGAIMSVPAHDQRDYDFAKKYGLEIKEVVSGGDSSNGAYTGEGTLINSGFLDGMDSASASDAIIQSLEEKKIGARTVNYRLRDWLVSRQRYWGAPIPIVYCEKCGVVPVPEEDLPVLLPDNVEFMPTGESPLTRCSDFVHTKCPKCGGDANRETDTMDTFMCSSWYELRYVDANNDQEAFNRELINKMMPVDKYIGGREHICLHLIYARFLTKALRDMGYLDFDEPFQSLVHQGTILGPDGQKMSKSKGNTVSPDKCIEQYGSDTLRAYLMFGFNYTEGGPWNDDGLRAMHDFILRYTTTVETCLSLDQYDDLDGEPERKLRYCMHQTIKGVTADYDQFKFNTAIAKIMTFRNNMQSYLQTGRNGRLIRECAVVLVQLMAPAAPHLSEEFWSMQGNTESIFRSGWPSYDETVLVLEEVELAVQFNGKFKGTITVRREAGSDECLQTVKQQYADKINGEVIKVIFIPGKIINLIMK